MNSLADFGFGQTGLGAKNFQASGQTIQLGQAPIRIDILTSIDGVEFEQARINRETGRYNDIPAIFMSKPDIIRSKRSCGRPQDLADIEKLEKI
jgi:hypothetical protein